MSVQLQIAQSNNFQDQASTNKNLLDANIASVMASAQVSGTSISDSLRFQTIADPAGAETNQIKGISADGSVVVGFSQDINWKTHGFIEVGGVYSGINDPAGSDTFVIAISADGTTVAGSYFDKGSAGYPGRYVGFTEKNGVYTTIDAPDSSKINPYATSIVGISDDGSTVAGNYSDINYNFHGFVEKNGVYTTIDYPGVTNGTSIAGISADGSTLVGTYTSDNKSHGFIKNNGIYTIIDIPASTSIEMQSISADGTTVVGYYQDNKAQMHGFIEKNGVYTIIDDPLGSHTFISGISADGLTVVGGYQDSSGQINGFIEKNGIYTDIIDPLSADSTGAGGNTEIAGISADGSMIFGTSEMRAFVATLSSTATATTQTVAQFIAGGSKGEPSHILDSSANLAANFGELQSRIDRIGSISLTDDNRLSINTMTYSACASVLSKLSGNYSLSLSDVLSADVAMLLGDSHVASLAVVDTDANISRNLDVLQKNIDGIVSITQTGKPVALSISSGQLISDSLVLNKITGNYTLSITDTTANIAAHLDAIQSNLGKLTSIQLTDKATRLSITETQFKADSSVLSKMTGSYSLSVTDVRAVDAASFLGNDRVALVGVTDTSANLGRNLDVLQKNISRISAIRTTDAEMPLSITKAQLKADATALSKITGDYALNISTVAIADISPTLGNSHVASMNLSDSGANFGKNLDFLQKHEDKLASITLTGPASLSITDAQFKADAALLSSVSGNYTLNVKNVAVADVAGVMRDSHVKSITVADTGANLASNLDLFQSNVAKIASITQTGGSTPLLITDTQFKADSAVLSKITGKYTVKVSDVPIADVASVLGNKHVKSITVADTDANLVRHSDILNKYIGKITDTVHLPLSPQIAPTLSSVAYDASTGVFTVRGSELSDQYGSGSIALDHFTFATGPQHVYHFSATADQVTNLTANGFQIVLSDADRLAVNSFGATYAAANGGIALGGPFYKMTATAGWDAGKGNEIDGINGVLTLASGWNNPDAIAIDTNGSLYIAAEKEIKEIRAVNHDVVPRWASSNIWPSSIAVDHAENVYFLIPDPDNAGKDEIIKIEAGTQVPSVWTSGLDGSSFGIAVDAKGNVFVADAANGGEVKEFYAGTNAVSTWATGLGQVGGIALDRDGNVFVASNDIHGTGMVSELLANPLVTSIPTLHKVTSVVSGMTGLSYLRGIALDGQDNIFVVGGVYGSPFDGGVMEIVAGAYSGLNEQSF